MDAARRACMCRLFSEQSAARSSRRIGSRPRIVTNRIVNTRDDVSTTRQRVCPKPPFWFCALPLVPCMVPCRAAGVHLGAPGSRMEMGARGRCEKGKRKSTRGSWHIGSRSGGRATRLYCAIDIRNAESGVRCGIALSGSRVIWDSAGTHTLSYLEESNHPFRRLFMYSVLTSVSCSLLRDPAARSCPPAAHRNSTGGATGY